jgi:hypothetical protein
MTDKITFTVAGERHELPIDGSKTPRVGSVAPEHKLTVTGSFAPTPSITFRKRDASVVMTIHPDGRITLGEDADPTEAAATCIEAMGAMIEKLIDTAVKAETARITKWLKAHGMRQVANSIERGEYK